MKTHLILLWVLFTSVCLGEVSLPVLNGVMTVGKESRFYLIGADGKSSTWLQVGDSFEDFALASYDKSTQALELRSGKESFRIVLKADAHVGEAVEDKVPATLAQADAVLRKMHTTEYIKRMAGSYAKTIEANMQPNIKRLVAAGVPPEEVEAAKRQMLAQLNAVMDPAQLEAQLSNVYSKVFSSDELDAMSRFYDTPLGEQIAKKQGDVQEKMQAVLQQRWAQAAPEISRIGKEIVAKAKASSAKQPAQGPGEMPPAK